MTDTDTTVTTAEVPSAIGTCDTLHAVNVVRGTALGMRTTMGPWVARCLDLGWSAKRAGNADLFWLYTGLAESMMVDAVRQKQGR